MALMIWQHQVTLVKNYYEMNSGRYADDVLVIMCDLLLIENHGGQTKAEPLHYQKDTTWVHQCRVSKNGSFRR